MKKKLFLNKYNSRNNDLFCENIFSLKICNSLNHKFLRADFSNEYILTTIHRWSFITLTP